jgi:hypothetical protein
MGLLGELVAAVLSLTIYPFVILYPNKMLHEDFYIVMLIVTGLQILVPEKNRRGHLDLH